MNKIDEMVLQVLEVGQLGALVVYAKCSARKLSWWQRLRLGGAAAVYMRLRSLEARGYLHRRGVPSAHGPWEIANYFSLTAKGEIARLHSLSRGLV
jgi:hypothetical protein